MKQHWKWLGLAGLAGVAATGAVVARDQRRRSQVTPDEVRTRLHERLAATGAGRPRLMCFSAEADLVAGAALVPLGLLALRQVRTPRDLPLASLPLLFGVHQLTEALVWAGLDGHVSADLARSAAWVYVVFALPVLPLLVPLAVWLVQDDRHRRRVLPFVGVGAVVAALMTRQLLVDGLLVERLDHALVYYVGLGPQDWFATSLYVVAVVGACLAASSWPLRAFGVVNLLALLVVAASYAEALASLWCVCAAASSVLVLVHLTHRARQHDEHPSLESPTDMSPAP